MRRFCALCLVLLVWGGVSGCGERSGPASTETTSTAFSTVEGKVEFLENYVSFRRTYDDLDFVVTYQNNDYGLVPGPNDWDVRIVAKVPRAELEQWTKGLAPTSLPQTGWLGVLPSRIDHSGVSTWFQKGGILVGVDEVNAIVVYQNWSR